MKFMPIGPPMKMPYTGPAIPPEYIEHWQRFTNLTKEQIAIFQSFPQDLLKYARTKRWEKEISGLTILDMQVTTDHVSQQKIAGLKQAVDNGTLTEAIHFSAKNGIKVLWPADVTLLYRSVFEHVENTYTVWATLSAAITAGSITTRAQIDSAYGDVAGGDNGTANRTAVRADPKRGGVHAG